MAVLAAPIVMVCRAIRVCNAAITRPLFGHPFTRRVQLPARVLLLAIAASTARLDAQSVVQYVYDEVGRLVAVIAPSGEAAVYTYDAVGNLLSIARKMSTEVSVIEFTPHSGPVGATVTVHGTGFSATANQNTLTFNGMPATITSATATTLLVTVPSGATTGPIAVTSPNGSATSTASFSVTTASAPTSTGFTPTIGTSGTSVSVSGTNFEPAAAYNRVEFNNTLASLASASSSLISTTVPPQTASGRISVATPNGAVISTADFYIPPAPFVPNDCR